MTNQEIMIKMEEKKIIAIARGIKGEDAVKVAEALYAGGIEMVEVPFNMKNPEDKTTDQAIKAIADAMKGKMIVGCGTCSYVELVDRVHEAGGKFIISADMNPEVIKRTKELGMISIPGVATGTEVMAAVKAGADYVKVFPAGSFGPGYIKALKGPFSHVKYMAVGGVNEDNIKDFIDVGCVGVGIGGSLVRSDYIANGEFDKITAIAKEMVKELE